MLDWKVLKYYKRVQKNKKSGLNTGVEVVNKKQFDLENINKFDTICIDYIQVFNKDYIHNFMKELMQRNIRIIVVSQMNRYMEIEDNIFETVSQTNSENS
jgi:hypothetical protein